MADKEKYIINVKGRLIEVTSDVYYTYFHMERQERGQEEKKVRNGVMSYNALDTEELNGVENLPDLMSPSMEDLAIKREIYNKLTLAIDALPQRERELIRMIFYCGFTEARCAKIFGISQQAISYRLGKALYKLKRFMEQFS